MQASGLALYEPSCFGPPFEWLEMDCDLSSVEQYIRCAVREGGRASMMVRVKATKGLNVHEMAAMIA